MIVTIEGKQGEGKTSLARVIAAAMTWATKKPTTILDSQNGKLKTSAKSLWLSGYNVVRIKP